MLKRLHFFRMLCLALLIVLLMIFMLKNFWAEDFDNQQASIYTLSSHHQHQMLDYESKLCLSPNIPIKPPPNNNIRCPQKPIVTVQQLGRLGNQMWEYISVWAAAKKTGREPYVPSCLIHELEKIFHNLTVPPLSYLAYCPIVEYPVAVTEDKLNHSNGSILLPRIIQRPTYIAPLLSEIRRIFQFKQHIVEEIQRLLHRASQGLKNITYVGVHVRRTDYIKYLKGKYNASAVKADYFLRQMNVFRNKYKPVMFVVVSDNPKWCERELRGDDIVVMKNNSPAQDLAIMAACNHSIIDYGTYGMWGAILAGGDTLVYNLGKESQEFPTYELLSAYGPNTDFMKPRIRKPIEQKPIVTVQQLGQLGNQMYEYISVWAIAKKTGREPYVPSCLIHELEEIFHNLTLPPLSYLAYCTVEKFPVEVTAVRIDHSNGSILLPRFAQLPKYTAPLVNEIHQMFQFKEHLVYESQKLLHNASRGVKNITYVGVHVRRTDYEKHLKKWFKSSMVKPDFFLRQMNVFRNKYKPVMFVVMSDDPEWCERELRGDDIVVMRNNSPGQDLAIMAACNHSIIGCGTYGMWGALLAGGDTLVYNLGKGAAFGMASVLPNWHIVT